MRRPLVWGLAFISLLLLLVAGGYGFLRGSAPKLDGTTLLPGLSAPVTVTRDALGVPTLSGQTRADAIRALGYLHAQDRFFEMDILRRLAAGELAALVGPAALDVDRSHRLFRLREVAQQVVARATPAQQRALRAYADGVNAGLRGLHTWPFEYGLLMQRPEPWRPEDSVLVIFAMYFDLQDSKDKRESDLAVAHAALPPELYRFLAAPGTQWDAPIAGQAFETPAIPGPDVIDLRKPSANESGKADGSLTGRTERDFPWMDDRRTDAVVGSNNWAVSAAHGAGGHALLANDMHLGLRVPDIWYRAQLRYEDPAAGSVTATGVTLPGVPSLVVGSNGHVAWGFTNSYGDWVDLVLLHPDPDDPDEYRTASGFRHFDHHAEIIRVKGAPDVTLDVRDTIWGPVLDKDPSGVWRAVHWMADDPAATNLELGELEKAQDVGEAMAIANRAGMPEQNFVTADAAGHIAWTLAGRIPLRKGYDPSLPAYWDQPGTGWMGWLDPDRYPRILNPPGGRLWTANARVVDGAMLEAIGDGGYDLGARAHQIRDGLMAKDRFAPSDMLAIQLDDQAVFLARWRSLLLRLLTPESLVGHPERAEFRRDVMDWGDHAAVDSVGYRLVRTFRLRVEEKVFDRLTVACRQADPDFNYRSFTQREGALWAMVSQQPPNLLDPSYRSWDALMMAAMDEVIGTLRDPDAGLAQRTWGEQNTVRIRHPLSAALPWLPDLLDMEAVPLPGDSNMPRVQGVDFGASERMVVEPGHEENGIFEMPTGQSGWPLSPFYRNSEPIWEHGQPAPFLPGAVMHTLVFQPAD